MDSLASTAIYLASLTAGPAPATLPVATVIVTPVMDVEAGPADRQVEANPFAAARARGARSLDEAIADVVRHDAVEDAAIGVGTGLAIDPERPRDSESLNVDIAAEHDARIGFIKQKMDELLSHGESAAPQLERLAGKLRLAMAARCLAGARQASEHLLRDADTAGAGACLATPAAAVASAGSAPRGPKVAHDRPPSTRHRLPSARHPAAPGMAVASARRRSPGAAVAGHHRDPRHLASNTSPAAEPKSASAIRPARAASRHSADIAHAAASDRARRLLATARHLLEGVSPPHADITLAGMLHWQGSDTWSLADYATSAA